MAALVALVPDRRRHDAVDGKRRCPAAAASRDRPRGVPRVQLGRVLKADLGHHRQSGAKSAKAVPAGELPQQDQVRNW